MALAQRVDPAPNAPRLLAERALDRMREFPEFCFLYSIVSKINFTAIELSKQF